MEFFRRADVINDSSRDRRCGVGRTPPGQSLRSLPPRSRLRSLVVSSSDNTTGAPNCTASAVAGRSLPDARGWSRASAGRPVLGPTIAPPRRDLERLHNGKREALKEAAIVHLEEAINNIKAIDKYESDDWRTLSAKAKIQMEDAIALIGALERDL